MMALAITTRAFSITAAAAAPKNCPPASSFPPHVAQSLLASLRRSAALVSNVSPLHSLLHGQWVKLICGASFEDVADVRNLSMVYTLAGVDCIDCAADPSVVYAVTEGIDSAIHVAQALDSDVLLKRPWVMVSINDDEDLHFRKAEFDPKNCPANCPRPCERICPASAIQFNTTYAEMTDKCGKDQKHILPDKEGVLTERCYGCGRCLLVCPLGLIGTKAYVRSFEAVTELLNMGIVEAVEIHTSARHLEPFAHLWESLKCSMQSLKLIAISLPDLGDDMLTTMWNLYGVMKPSLKSLNLWQMDGRPMSGDIGAGATKAAVALAAKVVACSNRPPGFLQLAGGTNAHTMEALKRIGLSWHVYRQDAASGGETEFDTLKEVAEQSFEHAAIAGIAYGGYARKVVSEVLKNMSSKESTKLENHPLLLLEALERASSLVSLSKGYYHTKHGKPV